MNSAAATTTAVNTNINAAVISTASPSSVLEPLLTKYTNPITSTNLFITPTPTPTPTSTPTPLSSSPSSVDTSACFNTHITTKNDMVSYDISQASLYYNTNNTTNRNKPSSMYLYHPLQWCIDGVDKDDIKVLLTFYSIVKNLPHTLFTTKIASCFLNNEGGDDVNDMESSFSASKASKKQLQYK